MKRFFYTPILMPHWSQDLLLTIPRVIAGLLLTLDFGSSKFGLPWSPPENNLGFFEVAFWFPHDVADYGGIFAMFPAFFAWMGAFAEAVGGIAWVVGWQTRLFSFLIACTMLVAIFAQQWNAGTWNMLPAMGFLWISMYHLVLGSGRFGLDYLIARSPILAQMGSMFRSKKMLGTCVGFLFLTACVQPTQTYRVQFDVKLPPNTKVTSLTIHGWDYPLSWEAGLPLNPVVKDSLYTVTVLFHTGRLYTDYKFKLNGAYELTDQPNRKIVFNQRDSIYRVEQLWDKKNE
jgi:putative oxidoreductase